MGKGHQIYDEGIQGDLGGLSIFERAAKKDGYDIQ